VQGIRIMPSSIHKNQSAAAIGARTLRSYGARQLSLENEPLASSRPELYAGFRADWPEAVNLGEKPAFTPQAPWQVCHWAAEADSPTVLLNRV
jgi:hypothetical protein